MTVLYRLDENNVPVPTTILELARLGMKFPHHVRNTFIDMGTERSIQVSTAFLYWDHNYGKDGPPLVFETRVFGPVRLPYYNEKHATWAEAEEGHGAALEWVKVQLMKLAFPDKDT
jgi:hypothetical protein